MAVLQCQMPGTDYRFTGSSAPGQLFFPGDPVTLQMSFQTGSYAGTVGFQLDLVEITTRDPSRAIAGTATGPAGPAPLIALAGQPIQHQFSVPFADAPETRVVLERLPVPDQYGTYAIILVRGRQRQFVTTVCRVPKPLDAGSVEQVPITGDFAFFDHPERYGQRAATYRRMGVRGVRVQTRWAERADGSYDWEQLDPIFAAAEQHQLQLLVTLGAHPSWSWPFGPDRPTPAVVGPGWDGNADGGQADRLAAPKHFPRYSAWIIEFCQRYWKNGRGALWGIENYHQPWEGGSPTGWARDSHQYRLLHRLIAQSAWEADRRIKICAASSIMNTEDKFYADGSREFDQYLDVFTDHYVLPALSYGPLVARARGKVSLETETWLVRAEHQLPQIVQFLAAGQQRLAPSHPSALFDPLPGTDDPFLIPTPLVAATAAANHFLTGRTFEKVVFHTHLPWVFQFGKDNDPEGVLVLLGRLRGPAGNDPKERPWAQIETAPPGTLTVQNGDGRLQFFDVAGNPLHFGARTVRLPLSTEGMYIRCAQGPAAAAARLKAAAFAGQRPVEILPRDFSGFPTAPGARLTVTLQNRLNRSLLGILTAQTPPEIHLDQREQLIELAAGAQATLAFPVLQASNHPANAYPFTFTFRSPAGTAEYTEVLNVAVAPKGTRAIDGNLDDWPDAPGVVLELSSASTGPAAASRRSWAELKSQQPDGHYAEFKLAWDEAFLYLAAQVNDPTAELDTPRLADRAEDRYFHSAASDARPPFQQFIEQFPGRSFAEVPYVYCVDPAWDSPYRRDRLQFALDVSEGWHDMAPTTNQVPLGFHAVPDADYEYSLYLCAGGGSELWRLLAPGVPRRHDYPRQLRGERTTGPVPGAQHVVRREGATYVYEVAIPQAELADLKLVAGSSFGLMVRAGNRTGPDLDYARDKAVAMLNGLTLHPYWELSPNCGVRWTLVEPFQPPIPAAEADSVELP